MNLSNLNVAFDVPTILTALVLISGAIYLIDVLFRAKKRRVHNRKMGIVVEYARSFFPIFLLVLVVRTFFIQPYRVPTGSLEPTILPGDFLVVKQYSYGLRLPVLNTKIIGIGKPKRGDITLFRYPDDLKQIFVKRVVGLPGDHVVYRDKVLTINGKPAWQTSLGMALEHGENFTFPVQVRLEHLGDRIHKIFIKPGYREDENIDVVVPANSYFVMGDNRDNSRDSREWGFVPEDNLVGKAFGIWLSWDSKKHRVRWDRIGKKIK